MPPILSHVSKVINYPLLKSIETKMISTTQKVNLLSKRAFSSIKDNPPTDMMSFKEFVSRRVGSKEQYSARIKPSFPNATEEKLDMWYDDECRLGYRDYINSVLRPGHHLSSGLILDPDYVDDEVDKP